MFSIAFIEKLLLERASERESFCFKPFLSMALWKCSSKSAEEGFAGNKPKKEKCFHRTRKSERRRINAREEECHTSDDAIKDNPWGGEVEGKLLSSAKASFRSRFVWGNSTSSVCESSRQWEAIKGIKCVFIAPTYSTFSRSRTKCFRRGREDILSRCATCNNSLSASELFST